MIAAWEHSLKSGNKKRDELEEAYKKKLAEKKVSDKLLHMFDVHYSATTLPFNHQSPLPIPLAIGSNV